MNDGRAAIRAAGGLAAAVLLAAAMLAAQTRGLSEAARLSAIYDAILDARFADAESAVASACGPAPPVACRVLGTAATWWQIQLDPASRALDGRFLTEVERAIAEAAAWTRQEPGRAEAWFYLGGAYAARVQWRVLRGERLAAARDGKRIKDALERALAIDPTLEDAHFGIGLYRYAADVAPRVLRVLRWLLFLPGGDRARGLREMERARTRGALIGGEADFQLHLFYLWYEQRTDRALELLGGLRARYPRNPLFPLLVADIEHVYLHDHAGALATCRDVRERARAGRLEQADLAETRARLGIARELDALGETDRALAEIDAIVASRPAAPADARALAELQRGDALARLGFAARAAAAYAAALAALPADDPQQIGPRARAGQRRRIDVRTGEAFRLSLEGWRAVQAGQLAEAERALARAIALDEHNPVIRFRAAALHTARNEHARALDALERVIAARGATPPTILAAAYLEAGRLLERSGATARAIGMYREAIRVRLADQATRDAAAQALARLGGIAIPRASAKTF